MKNIQIEGFKSIRSLDLELGSLNVLIGANGAGKSNLISFFRLLNAMVNERLEPYVEKRGGARAMLHFGGEKTSSSINASLKFGLNTYKIKLIQNQANDFAFEEELLLFDGPLYGQMKVSLGTGHTESLLNERIKNETHSTRRKMGEYVVNALRSWKVAHFHDTTDKAPARRACALSDHSFFRNEASNLPAFLYHLKESNNEAYINIRDTVRLVAPFFDDFVLEPDIFTDNLIYLQWLEVGSDYTLDAYHLSDGTLRFVCLATLLLQPEPPATIIIDEPELGLHPYAITILAALLLKAAKHIQLIVSTQSVSLLNEMPLEDVIVVDKKDGESTFTRTDPKTAERWLKDYSLGEMWEKNILGGRPSR